MQKNYQQFDLGDFVSDDLFIKWAQGKSPQDNNFWEAYISANPAQKSILLEAKELVAGFNFQQEEISSDFFDKLNERINHSIDEVDAVQAATKNTSHKLGYRIAAAIAASLLIALAFLFYPKHIIIENGFAGIKQVVLPDSSIVLLNANSSLVYAKNWDKNDREVKLIGEAFFKIKHTTEKGHVLPFKVYANDLKLNVLGTSFNVISRNAKVDIILKTGRLKVTSDEEEVYMKPADHLFYDKEKGKFILTKISNDDYLDWTRMEFVFNDLSIAQVTQKLEYFFDVKVQFEDEAIKKEKLSGRIGLLNINETFHTLELLLNKKIVINGKQVTIAK